MADETAGGAPEQRPASALSPAGWGCILVFAVLLLLYLLFTVIWDPPAYRPPQ